jgi:outer membrane protein TolC
MKALLRSVLPAACAALIPIATAAQSAPAAVVPPATEPVQFDLAAALREDGEPLGANDAARQAIASSPNAERARAATAQAQASAKEAFVAVYPRLDLEASYTRLSQHEPRDFGGELNLVRRAPDGSIIDTTTGQIDMPNAIEDLFLFQARVTFPVSDLFFSVLPRYEAANRVADLQKVRETAEDQTVALQAKQAYYEYARARAALLIAKSALAQNEAQRRDVEALVRGGALARVEQMRAEAQVATARVAVARSQGSVAISLTALRSIMHAEGEGAFAVTEDLSQPMPALTQTKAQLLAAARANRSELKALRGMAQVHERTISAEQGGKLPKLSVLGQYDFANPNQRVAPQEEKFISSWQAGAVLSWSPNDFAVADKRVDRVRAQRVSTEGDLRVLEDALVTEVSQAYEDFVAAREAQSQALSGIAAAEETYRVRREQFRAGSVVATEVIQAETELRRARLELVSAAIDARIASARIDRAIEEKR